MENNEMTEKTEEKEVVSRNFIEQEIDKDLAEGVYDTVHTTISAGTKRLSAYRTCQVYSFKLWTGTGIRRQVQHAF